MTAAAPATRSLKNTLAGGLMALAGAAVVLEARSFGLGTPARMGPGFYPTVVGAALAVVGLLIVVVPEGGDAHEAAAFGAPDWRGWACIILGVGLFVAVGDRFGLGPATFACVFVSALGDRRSTPLASLALAAGATAMAGLVFTLLLKFQLPFFTLAGR